MIIVIQGERNSSKGLEGHVLPPLPKAFSFMKSPYER